MSAGRILLVEDSPQDVELTLSALSKQSLDDDVAVATDGEQALDYLFRRGAYATRTGPNPVVVFLDVKLPKLDGIEVLRALRSAEAFARLPVVMLTSSREEHDVARSYALGVNAYVVKPVDYRGYVDAIGGMGQFWAIINQPPPAGRA